MDTSQQQEAGRKGGLTNRGKMTVRNTSGVVGVSWARRGRKWVAAIRVNGKPIVLGRFVKIEDAAAARRKAEQEHWR